MARLIPAAIVFDAENHSAGLADNLPRQSSAAEVRRPQLDFRLECEHREARKYFPSQSFSVTKAAFLCALSTSSAASRHSCGSCAS